jgi:hypothetical protein
MMHVRFSNPQAAKPRATEFDDAYVGIGCAAASKHPQNNFVVRNEILLCVQNDTFYD